MLARRPGVSHGDESPFLPHGLPASSRRFDYRPVYYDDLCSHASQIHVYLIILRFASSVKESVVVEAMAHHVSLLISF